MSAWASGAWASGAWASGAWGVEEGPDTPTTPFLLLDDVVVPVALDRFEEMEPHEVGERVRAFDGTLRISVRDRRRRFRGTTRPLAGAEYLAVRTVLESTTVTGGGLALDATLSLAPRILGAPRVRVAGGIRHVVQFELEEA